MGSFFIRLIVCLAVLSKAASQSLATNVLMVSIDGMHQSDLEWYIDTYPESSMASIVGEGVQFTKAHAPYPSNAYAGMAGIATGGNPSSTGIYHSSFWSPDMYPAGTTDCSLDPPQGTIVHYDGRINLQSNSITGEVILDKLGNPVPSETQFTSETNHGMRRRLQSGKDDLQESEKKATVRKRLPDNSKSGLKLGSSTKPDVPYGPPSSTSGPTDGDVNDDQSQTYFVEPTDRQVAQMRDPMDIIDVTSLPVSPNTCMPVYPHQYILTNTLFEVVRENNLRTAWCDDSPAYDMLNGKSGKGVQDFFTPEIDSWCGGEKDWNWKSKLEHTKRYDSFKTNAVLHQISGKCHKGVNDWGVPAIYGTNFQAVSTAQTIQAIGKDGRMKGGYMDDGYTPGPLLLDALNFISNQLGQFREAISHGPAESRDSTVIVLTAKHGNSPQRRSSLVRVDASDIVQKLNKQWAARSVTMLERFRRLVDDPELPLVAYCASDAGMQCWLNDQTPSAVAFAEVFFMGFDGYGTSFDACGSSIPTPFTQSGLIAIYSGPQAATLFGVYPDNLRVPDLVGIAAYGIIYGDDNDMSLANNGGFNTEDRSVPLVISSPSLPHGNQGAIVAENVFTIQLAPTILSLLGLDPFRLVAVQIEGTEVLPMGYSAYEAYSMQPPEQCCPPCPIYEIPHCPPGCEPIPDCEPDPLPDCANDNGGYGYTTQVGGDIDIVVGDKPNEVDYNIAFVSGISQSDGQTVLVGNNKPEPEVQIDFVGSIGQNEGPTIIGDNQSGGQIDVVGGLGDNDRPSLVSDDLEHGSEVVVGGIPDKGENISPINGQDPPEIQLSSVPASVGEDPSNIIERQASPERDSKIRGFLDTPRGPGPPQPQEFLTKFSSFHRIFAGLPSFMRM